MPGSSLSVEHVEKWFRQGKKSGKKGPWLQVLDDISVEVTPGEFLAIVGVSGCGKTSLLRILAGLILPNSGRVVLEGDPIDGVPDRIGFVFQDPALLPWETVWRNVQLGLGPKRVDTTSQRQLVEGQLDLIGLKPFASSYPYQLSGGMQQRVGLARALIGNPRLLLLDEPLGALDAFTRVRLQEELSRLLAEANLTSVLVTHDVEEALYLADRVVVMGGQPGTIRSIITVPGLRPRDRNSFLKDPEVAALRMEITESIMHQPGVAANL